MASNLNYTVRDGIIRIDFEGKPEYSDKGIQLAIASIMTEYLLNEYDIIFFDSISKSPELFIELGGDEIRIMLPENLTDRDASALYMAAHNEIMYLTAEEDEDDFDDEDFDGHEIKVATHNHLH